MAQTDGGETAESAHHCVSKCCSQAQMPMLISTLPLLLQTAGGRGI